MTAIPVEERQHWIGASEVASLFDLSPFKTRFELWHEKSGTLPPPNLDDNERVMAGRHLETGIAAWAAEKWRWPIESFDDYSPHPSVPKLGASLDFHTPDSGDPVEIKTVDYGLFRDNWATDQDVITDAPMNYVLQVQAQMACRPGTERGWLVACVGGNKLYRMEIPRHDAMIERIEREVQAFWDSVEAGQPPAPNFALDADAIAALYSGEGGEKIDLRENNRATQLAYLYQEESRKVRESEKVKRAALAELKTMMNDAQSAVLGDGFTVKATWIKEAVIEKKGYFRFNVIQREIKDDE